ncbi:hypothetical protein LIER_41911 [Lithospermum erythrorhizon]|uniref:Aminotransferase-like plant mobile domain-containing protein n=1 Tax=Lithospermum erythrorhizon TaxID=34254 RepID=A0AAV3RGM9_LITER
MVLGGYLVLGEPISAMPTGDLISMVGELERERGYGRQVALAPVVLASLYRDLRLMTKRVKIQSGPSIAVAAPFQLLQLWAFERFPLLGPKNPNALQRPGEVRVTRWHKLISSCNLPLVRSALKERKNYKWRPYATDLENWYVSPFRGIEKFYGDCSNLSREL